MRAISYAIASELGPRDLRQLKQKPFTTRHRKRRGSNLKRRPAPRRTCLHLSNIKRWPPKKAQNNKSLRANPSRTEIKPGQLSSFAAHEIVTLTYRLIVCNACWQFLHHTSWSAFLLFAYGLVDNMVWVTERDPSSSINSMSKMYLFCYVQLG